MTKADIEILLEQVATWPEAAQEEFVQSLADIERRHLGTYRLNEEERAAVRQGLEDIREGRIASDDEVAAVFARYRA
jgi:predicted transcriptional regulator